MAITVNVGGVGRNVPTPQVNIDGVWRTVETVSNNVDGVWKTSYPNYFTVTADNRSMIGYTDETAELIIPESFISNDGVAYEVVGIDNKAFRQKSSLDSFYLQSITIPSSVVNIGHQLFSMSRGTTSAIYVDNNNPKYSSQDGVLFNKDLTELAIYPMGKSDSSYQIPDSVTSIRAFAFSECVYLNNIIIPNSVTSIGNAAFGYSDSIKNVTIPNSVVNIGQAIFVDCPSLETIVIPDSITQLTMSMFTSCISLSTITLPNTITNIDRFAFDCCNALTTVNYTGTEEQWNAITIAENNDPLINATKVFNYTD